MGPFSTTTTTMFSFSSNKKPKPPKMKSPRPAPRLERRNAAKNIDYEHHPHLSAAAFFASPLGDDDDDDEDDVVFSPGEMAGPTKSLEIYSNQTSFRIGGGVEGEVDLICRSLGLSGPEDFAIPHAAWEASRAQRLSHSSAAVSRLSPPQHQHPMEESKPAAAAAAAPDRDDRSDGTVKKTGSGSEGGIRGTRPPTLATPESLPLAATEVCTAGRRNSSNNNPSPSSVLPPPPSMSMSMSLPALDRAGSAWDLVRSFAPDDDGDDEGGKRRVFSDEEEEEEEEEEMLEDVTSTSNNDCDMSCCTMMFVISPNGRFKRSIRSWMRGHLLGSGSFGTVYEGFGDDGIFFAVKEVSLLDQGSNAQQCILQLEQEIALLSQFEHENIVQYYGTDKEEAKLFIFIELVTQGSLASLYRKYHLQESQVSVYTRQILKGLYYLHERNVVHRDIKCANILVHANGSVKLADFGLAKEITKFNMLKSCKGSVYWMAPEVVNPKKTYGPAADIWSLGCTVLEMLTRQIPYPNLEWQHAFYKIGRGSQPPIPNHLSRDARDFISQCVQVNPEDRPSACQLLEHPFVRRPLPSSGSGSDSSSSPSNERWN